MRLFTINHDNEMLPYNEHDFKVDNFEQDLEILLEKNPQYFFEESNILIVGRQIATNLDTYIDLLGVDKSGNTIVIELKRDKTPRETLSQILEYASFIENLDYEQINSIFKNYYGNESDLDDYHREYFSNEEKVSFNKKIKLLIIAQSITNEIKQTSIYLRKNGLDIYCMEFKYFKTKSGEKIISSDFIVGEGEYKRQEVKSSSLPKVSEKEFLNELDANGKTVFIRLFEHAKNKDLFFIWGSKGFSLNVQMNTENVAMIFGYPPSSVYKQSIYTGFENILKKVHDSSVIIDSFRSKLISTGLFAKAGDNLKWVIKKEYPDKIIDDFFMIVDEVSEIIRRAGGATATNTQNNGAGKKTNE